MGALGIITVSIILISLYKFIPRLIKFIKFTILINKIPGPAFYPIPYVALAGANKPEDIALWLQNQYGKFKEGIMQLAIVLDAYIFISKPQHIEAVLNKTETLSKATLYHNYQFWLGDGLLTSSDEKALQKKKLLMSAFQFGVLDQFIEIMSEKAEILVQCIENDIQKNAGEAIDFYKYSVRCALDIICETSMGTNIDVQRNKDIEYFKALNVLLYSFIKRLLYPWLHWDWIFYRSKMGKNFKKSLEVTNTFIIEIIKKRRELRKMKNREMKRDEFGNRQKRTFLDLLMDLDENETFKMGDEGIKQQVDKVVFAGHDTVAAAVNWAIFNIGNNPDVQLKIHEELDAVFGNSNDLITLQKISQLSYLDRVIKENLRLCPSIPLIGRHVTEDIELDGYTIPKGANLGLCIFFLHRDPELWPNPMKFNPDRFLPENCRKRHPYAYIPFSGGPGNCIGIKFAMAEQKIILTKILRKWRVKSVKSMEEMKYQPNVILHPYEENRIYFFPR
ncbi:cytochrome P450 4C1-like [Leptopilina boulardi]|uniref:cytochrome P450 4C1-like n=1 Tax=Leptopilina boulardi TaxID=63433 RepID=UPI0021F5D268|nr:cytochrome P450 4C1-like [Leptopilina boulardi]